MSEDITIEFDRDLIDKIAVQSMKRLVESLEEDIEKRKKGEHKHGFFHVNKRKDIAEMNRHIDALWIVLKYYGEE